jgi:prepilin-type processing-associated H-X9-DG protein
MLLPALSAAKVKAQAIKCMGNSRQLMMAWIQYYSDNNDLLVNNWDTVSIQSDLAASPPIYRNWVADVMGWGADPQIFDLSGITACPFYKYAGGTGIFKCPADNFLSPIQRIYVGQLQAGKYSTTGRPRSYSMNCFFGPSTPTWMQNTFPDKNEFFSGYRQFIKATVIPNPSQLFVALDEHPDNINDGYFKDGANPDYTSAADWPGGVWGDMPGSNHAGGCGFSFADGHAEVHKWKSRKVTILPVTYGPVPHNMISSDPDAIQDIAWFGARASVPR